MRPLAFLLVVTTLGCATATKPAAPCNLGVPLVNPTLWMQSAAEFRASALQTYAAARNALDAALLEPSSLPPAIILDLDETALDNSRFAARSIEKGKAFSFGDDWSAWVGESASAAIPGAEEFLSYAASRGVTPFYITNRTANMETSTRLNLTKLGFPLADAEDTLLTRGEREEWNTTDKTTRRDFVASRYRVLLLLGDDVNDFTSASGRTVAERAAIVDGAAESWGTRWFIVPNAIYGSWQSAVTGGTGTPCEQIEKAIDSLQR
ncbi:MAG: 5'-nucleotidase, lipoprotein e(P4) family [Thermoanaerobaculia bacterium]